MSEDNKGWLLDTFIINVFKGHFDNEKGFVPLPPYQDYRVNVTKEKICCDMIVRIEEFERVGGIAISKAFQKIEEKIRSNL